MYPSPRAVGVARFTPSSELGETGCWRAAEIGLQAGHTMHAHAIKLACAQVPSSSAIGSLARQSLGVRCRALEEYSSVSSPGGPSSSHLNSVRPRRLPPAAEPPSGAGVVLLGERMLSFIGAASAARSPPPISARLGLTSGGWRNQPDPLPCTGNHAKAGVCEGGPALESLGSVPEPRLRAGQLCSRAAEVASTWQTRERAGRCAAYVAQHQDDVYRWHDGPRANDYYS